MVIFLWRAAYNSTFDIFDGKKRVIMIIRVKEGLVIFSMFKD